MKNAYVVWFIPDIDAIHDEPYIAAVFSSLDRAKMYVQSMKNTLRSDEQDTGEYEIEIHPLDPEPDKQPEYYLIQGTSIGDIEMDDIGFRATDTPVAWSIEVRDDENPAMYKRISYEGTIPAGEGDTVDSVLARAYLKIIGMYDPKAFK